MNGIPVQEDWITKRILSEYKKYYVVFPGDEWARIAAAKIRRQFKESHSFQSEPNKVKDIESSASVATEDESKGCSEKDGRPCNTNLTSVATNKRAFQKGINEGLFVMSKKKEKEILDLFKDEVRG